PSHYIRCYLPHPYLHSFPTRRSSDLPGENEPVHVIRVHSKEAPGKQRFCTVVKHARSLTDKPSIYRKRRERRIGVSQTGAIVGQDRKSTRLNSSHGSISYAVFCLKKK